MLLECPPREYEQRRGRLFAPRAVAEGTGSGQSEPSTAAAVAVASVPLVEWARRLEAAARQAQALDVYLTNTRKNTDGDAAAEAANERQGKGGGNVKAVFSALGSKWGNYQAARRPLQVSFYVSCLSLPPSYIPFPHLLHL